MNSDLAILLPISFTAGLLGSGHCLGMCGGIVCAFFMRIKSQSLMPNIVYHLSRILIYGIFGLMAAFVGETVIATGKFGMVQGILKIVVGIIVALLGWDFIGKSPISYFLNRLPTNWINIIFNKITNYGIYRASSVCGMLNAFLPCSLTLAMVFQATVASSIINGGLLMLAFGFGTLPSMIFASWLFTKLGHKTRKWLSQITGILLVIMGLVTVYKGYLFIDKLL